jgi:hypothetical protein
MNLLRNGNFEADWSEEQSHHCFVCPHEGEPEEREIGNIFTPPGWIAWFRHEEGTWAQPEGRDARDRDPDRMHSGDKGFLLFTFSRKHDAGLLQQVPIQPGKRLRFSAWAHAWSNHKAPTEPDRFPHPDDPRWSEGAGYDAVAWPAGSQPLTGDPQQDAKSNFTFWVGLDPTGATNPLGRSVLWGEGAHIYNGFHQVPAVEAVAENDTVTVFLRSQTLWAFKHNDAYWDDARLESLEGVTPVPPPGERGKVREQYRRIYVLLPPGTDKTWAHAIIDATWSRSGYTLGQSADDAGIGDLAQRIVIAVNPEQWGPGENGTGLKGFFEQHYPGVEYRPVRATTPQQLRQQLEED